MHKGGVGGNYSRVCNVPVLKTLPVIKINVFNHDKDQQNVVTYGSFKDFCRFMLKSNNFGIKIFKSRKELDEEKARIMRFLETFDLDFAKKYTCLAINKNLVFLDIIVNGHYLLIFENASGDLTTIGNLNSVYFYENVYMTCYSFLKALHSKHVCYSDFKAANILWDENPFKRNVIRIIIGDLGSLCFPGETDPRLTDRNYTFSDPLKSDFLNQLVWVKKYLSNPERFEKAMHQWKTISNYIVDPQDNLLSVAKDWFHFGIAMIDFIVSTRDKRLYRFIEPIWVFFCSRPCITDEFYNFRMLLCAAGS